MHGQECIRNQDAALGFQWYWWTVDSFGLVLVGNVLPAYIYFYCC